MANTKFIEPGTSKPTLTGLTDSQIEALDEEDLGDRLIATVESVNILQPGEAAKFDKWLTADGPVRRATLVFLERPFKEMANKIEECPKTAEAMAALYHDLQESIPVYRELLRVLEAGEARMMLAFCGSDEALRHIVA